MRDTHYVDPQVRPIVAHLEATFGDYTALTVEETRAAFAAYARATAKPMPPECVDAYVDVPGPAGPIPCRVFRPADLEAGAPLMLVFTGGTYVCTSLDLVGYNPVALALSCRCVVLVPLHRLPPEHPFPAAYDDCFAVYRWALEHAGEIGADTRRIAVHGESSGGTLAAAVCIDARDHGLPQPCLQLLAEPLVEHDSETASVNEFSLMLSKAALRQGSRYYFGDAPPPPRASPLRAASLRGVAAAYVVTAGLDPLCDEGLAYVARLRQDGVTVAHRHHPGQLHGFFSMYDTVLQARIAFSEACAVVRLAFEGGLNPELPSA